MGGGDGEGADGRFSVPDAGVHHVRGVNAGTAQRPARPPWRSVPRNGSGGARGAVLALLLSLLLPAPAAAAGLQECAAIAAPAERLDCYDGLARAAATAARDLGAWTLDAVPSRLDATRSDLVLWTRSVNPVSGPAHAVLTLQCRDGEMAAVFDFGTFVGGGATRIEYRIGSGAVLAGDVTVAPDHRRFGVWERDRAIGFVKALYGQPQLRLRVIPPAGDPLLAAFDLAGLEDAAAPLREACGWE